MPLEEMIRKMTAMPAAHMGFVRRGQLKTGWAADICVFDPARVIDKATFKEPAVYPEGIRKVIVNGQLVVDDGDPHRAPAGKDAEEETGGSGGVRLSERRAAAVAALAVALSSSRCPAPALRRGRPPRDRSSAWPTGRSSPGSPFLSFSTRTGRSSRPSATFLGQTAELRPGLPDAQRRRLRVSRDRRPDQARPSRPDRQGPQEGGDSSRPSARSFSSSRGSSLRPSSRSTPTMSRRPRPFRPGSSGRPSSWPWR